MYREYNGRDYKIIVEGEKEHAHIRATGKVPKDIADAVEKRENNGLFNSFQELSFFANLMGGK